MNEEYKRSLAHLEKIVDIKPISGADNIQVCQVLGWECVIAKKDNFKVGDFVVYIEVDSIVPDRPEFEFLRDRKFRVRTIKLRKQISQGLVLPLSLVSPLTAGRGPINEGEDLTELLGIKHFDKDSPLNQKETEYKPQNKFLKFLLKYSLCRKIILPFIRKPKGSWPQWISRTDEERIQGHPGILKRHQDKIFYYTEKLDGTSSTFFLKKMKFGLFNKKIFGVCSRNIWLKTPDESYYWKMARKYDIEKILRKDGRELVIQGESIGEGIQKNKYGIKGLNFYVFNIIDSKTNRHFNLDEMEEFCKKNNLNFVPVIGVIQLKETLTVKDLVEMSVGKSKLNEKTEREGVVFRYFDSNGNKTSFKAISPKFLLDNNE